MKFIINNLVFLFCVTYLAAVKFRCDYKYHDLGWYKYHEIPSTWHDARLQCRLEGGMIVSPTTPAIKSAMLSLIGNTTIFTGIHATVSKGQFHSINGIPLALIPHEWADSEPDNKNNAESCLAFDPNGKFSDVNCDTPHPYICYREYSSADANVCGTPDPEYRLESRTNKCYKFHTTPRTFARAHFACAAEGGHLAIINSETESAVIRDIFAQYPGGKMIGNFWKDVAFIGFHNWGESADWTTVEGQSLQEAGFSKFSGGEPNNSTEGEYCGSVYRSGLINDLWCEKHFAFICEKKPDYPPVCDHLDEDSSIKMQPVY